MKRVAGVGGGPASGSANKGCVKPRYQKSMSAGAVVYIAHLLSRDYYHLLPCMQWTIGRAFSLLRRPSYYKDPVVV